MKRKAGRWAGALALVLLCTGVWSFLRAFTREEPLIRGIEWAYAAILTPDGGESPLDLAALWEQPELEEGELYFTGHMPEVDAVQELHAEISGGAFTLALDGRVLLESVSRAADGNFRVNQAVFSLVPEDSGRVVELWVRPEGALNIFPPYLRILDPLQLDAADMAYANLYGIPAGALAVAFVLICFLFYAGLLLCSPDWSLPLLAVASAALLGHGLAVGCGYAFLPPALNGFLCWGGFSYLPALLMAAYLLLNRRWDFWRRLGKLSLAAGTVLLIASLLSLAGVGDTAQQVVRIVREVFVDHYFGSATYWLTLYLIVACALIAAYSAVERAVRTQADASAMALKAELAVKSCRSLEEGSRRTAELRHEMKNELAALDLLYRKGDLEELGLQLGEMGHRLAVLRQVNFTGNFTVNAILQDAAARAAALEVPFDAQAVLPEYLPVEERDLCSLLMNLLDNALEAAGRVPEAAGRSVRFRCQVKSGFLAVFCENSYAGPLRLDPNTGWPVTSKPDTAAHGFGLRQMSAVAEKYHSLLDVSYTVDTFTVQTALKLPGN